ncbi:DltD domain-containing protein [Alkalihalobacillus alcalophilus ATCC 27647 = CGMCC 1.3604]|uniref:DltD domain-containing protein n=1 Tax=Alkalihalobacillus alcalophilus ATCC 27647 = CGMCC 1.3604 TaxID=1218173 RepID=A0A094WDF2_ALKAL|nr:DinB family protein [Alkalihalobacillus alcalophilus]KGA95764.1 DltD domain-containing protein [Alkalihalobacillus alcalophilus ATCC 27647 = CGMCC 1.3604]MED1560614.1 DinB family protein [Alkalihalobacillus alcalophilus]THG88392.1 DltD domain-containing protein [Alkalihalobacillus alcalophilus ATCC 27647 = CGMCC 1.3604]
MVHAKEILLNQLLANANDRSWYSSFQEAVKGLSEKEAFWKPDEDSFSIAEIVQHLIFWNETLLARYKNADFNAVSSPKDNMDTFSVDKGVEFSYLSEQLLNVLLQWQNVLTEEQLELKVNGYPVEAKWWALVSNAATHNAYHIGQIAYIRKLKK